MEKQAQVLVLCECHLLRRIAWVEPGFEGVWGPVCESRSFFECSEEGGKNLLAERQPSSRGLPGLRLRVQV